jgi:hypothetical protein
MIRQKIVVPKSPRPIELGSAISPPLSPKHKIYDNLDNSGPIEINSPNAGGPNRASMVPPPPSLLSAATPSTTSLLQGPIKRGLNKEIDQTTSWRQKLDYKLDIKDAKLFQDFVDFISKRKSTIFLFFITIVLTFLVFPLNCLSVIKIRLHEKSGQGGALSTGLKVSMFLGFFSSFVGLATGWALFYQQFDVNNTDANAGGMQSSAINISSTNITSPVPIVHSSSIISPRNNVGVPSSSNYLLSPSASGIPMTANKVNVTPTFQSKVIAFLSKHQVNLQRVFLLSINIVCISKFVHLKRFADCPLVAKSVDQDVLTKIAAGWSCQSADSAFLNGTTATIIVLPLVCLIALKESRFIFSLLYHFSVLLFYGLAYLRNPAPNFMVTLIIWAIVGSILLIDLHLQHLQMFFITIHLNKILEENEKMHSAMHANEMKHMIANVAHDLKTVSLVLINIHSSLS